MPSLYASSSLFILTGNLLNSFRSKFWGAAVPLPVIQSIRQYFGEAVAMLVTLLYGLRRDLVTLFLFMLVLRYIIMSLGASSQGANGAAPASSSSRILQVL